MRWESESEGSRETMFDLFIDEVKNDFELVGLTVVGLGVGGITLGVADLLNPHVLFREPSSPPSTSHQLVNLSVPEEDIIYAAGGTPGQGGTVQKSTDGGDTFSSVLETANALFSIICPTASVCTAGGVGSISHTLDGGTTWDHLGGLPAAFGASASVHENDTDDIDIWVAGATINGDGTIYHTNDHWANSTVQNPGAGAGLEPSRSTETPQPWRCLR